MTCGKTWDGPRPENEGGQCDDLMPTWHLAHWLSIIQNYPWPDISQTVSILLQDNFSIIIRLTQITGRDTPTAICGHKSALQISEYPEHGGFITYFYHVSWAEVNEKLLKKVLTMCVVSMSAKCLTVGWWWYRYWQGWWWRRSGAMSRQLIMIILLITAASPLCHNTAHGDAE